MKDGDGIEADGMVTECQCRSQCSQAAMDEVCAWVARLRNPSTMKAHTRASMMVAVRRIARVEDADGAIVVRVDEICGEETATLAMSEVMLSEEEVVWE